MNNFVKCVGLSILMSVSMIGFTTAQENTTATELSLDSELLQWQKMSYDEFVQNINQSKDNFNKLQSLATMGNMSAQFMLACYYLSSNNLELALDWTEKSARNGFYPAVTSLGEMFSSINAENSGLAPADIWAFIKENAQESLEELKRLADKGDNKAQFKLATVLFSQHKKQEAIKYLKLAVADKYLPAIMALASAYDEGKQTKRNYFKAKALFEQAAEQENPEAMLMLSNYYYHGYGVRLNYRTAQSWAGKACDLGVQRGCDLYAEIEEMFFEHGCSYRK